jgi:hypothetical protein
VIFGWRFLDGFGEGKNNAAFKVGWNFEIKRKY